MPYRSWIPPLFILSHSIKHTSQWFQQHKSRKYNQAVNCLHFLPPYQHCYQPPIHSLDLTLFTCMVHLLCVRKNMIATQVQCQHHHCWVWERKESQAPRGGRGGAMRWHWPKIGVFFYPLGEELWRWNEREKGSWNRLNGSSTRLDLPSCDVIGFLAIWAWGGTKYGGQEEGTEPRENKWDETRGRRCAEWHGRGLISVWTLEWVSWERGERGLVGAKSPGSSARSRQAVHERWKKLYTPGFYDLRRFLFNQ